MPYHADTLLQLAELYNHREGTYSWFSTFVLILITIYTDRGMITEHSTAADFIERALFTYERAFIGAFTFTGGGNRLDFDRVENRPFFLALHRQIMYV